MKRWIRTGGFAAASVLAVAAHAATQTVWTSIGPGPAAIEAAIAADASTHTVYLAAYGGGVFKSVDNGDTFQPANTGLAGALSVATLAMASHNPNLVYAGTEAGIYKTVDGGASWQPTSESGLALALAIDPTNPDVLFAGFNGGLRKTTNGGATWANAASGLGVPQVFSLAIDPSNPQVVYAGTTGQGAFKSFNGGATWTPLVIDSTVSILVDPYDSNVVYAGTNGKGVFKSTDAGATFAPVGSPDVGVVNALARSGDALYAATTTQGISVSDDGGRSWRNTGITKGTGLVLSVDSDGTVYAGTNFDGAFAITPRESGRGREWRRLGWDVLRSCNCQNGHALAIDPSNSRHIFFTTNDGGLLETTNGGITWNDGGTKGYLSRAPRSVAFDPQTPRFVYGGSFTGGGLFRSSDRGQHWEQLLFGSPAIYVAGIDVDPVDHTIYVSTFRSGDGVWKSIDFGETFTRIDRAPGAPEGAFLNLSGRGITVHPARHEIVFAGTGNGVWRSQDAGASWIRVSTTAAFKVTVDPTNPDVVYSAGATAVQKSTDGGSSFTPASVGLPAGVQTARTGALLIDPRNQATLYVGTEGAGVFRSTNAGASWSPMNDGLGDLRVYGLAMTPDGIIYASTASSVWALATN